MAGREAVRALIRKLLGVLAHRNAPASDIVRHGPRGNGEPALPPWVRRQAEALETDMVRFSGSVIPTTESLARRNTAKPGPLRWLRCFSPPGIDGVKLQASEQAVSAKLARRARKRPTLRAADEARPLATELGTALLSQGQHLRSEQPPLMLIVAGAPRLARHLIALQDSFRHRCAQLPIDRLEPASGADAIRIYDGRHQELVEAALVEVAVSVAALFDGSESTRPAQVFSAIQAALETEGLASDYEAVMEAAPQLRDLGYIWQRSRPEDDPVEPGNPSLMRHVAIKSALGIRH